MSDNAISPLQSSGRRCMEQPDNPYAMALEGSYAML